MTISLSVSYLPMLVFACAGLLLAQPAASLQQATLTRFSDNTCATKVTHDIVAEFTVGECTVGPRGLGWFADCTDPQNPTLAIYDNCGASKKIISAARLGITANPYNFKSGKCTKYVDHYAELTCPTPASPPSPPNSVVDIVQYKDAHCTEKIAADAERNLKNLFDTHQLLNNQCLDALPASEWGMKVSCADWNKPTVFWSISAADTKNDCKPGTLPQCTTVYTPGKCSLFAGPHGDDRMGYVEITCAAPGSTGGSAPPASTGGGLGGGAIFGIIIAVLVGVAGSAAGALFFLKKGPFAPKSMGGASIYDTSPGSNH